MKTSIREKSVNSTAPGARSSLVTRRRFLMYGMAAGPIISVGERGAPSSILFFAVLLAVVVFNVLAVCRYYRKLTRPPDLLWEADADHESEIQQEMPGRTSPAGTEDKGLPYRPPESGDLTDYSACEVRLLGPVEIVGASETVRRNGRVLELITFLALRGGDGASKDQIRCHLGHDPDHALSDGYFRQLCTRARACLGTAADGRSRLFWEGSRYRLHPDVAVDWNRFQALAAAETRSGNAGIYGLECALDLVRGEPLGDVDFWWLDVAAVEQVRATIVDVACRLASFQIEENPSAAASTARRGLFADTTSEQLYRLLMSAENELGNVAGIHHAYEMCLAELARLDLLPHPDTAALYRNLASGG